MQSYEVEIKSLLGSAERADEVRRAMKEVDPSCTMASKNKQLNHYFNGGTLQKLYDATASVLSDAARSKLQDFAKKAKDFSVRTRLTASNAQAGEKDGTVLLVVKASIDDTTSANGIARMEFEEPVCVRDPRTGRNVPATLDELDSLVLSAGFEYEAKWSREREEYVCRGTNVTLDKNAGYGWLAEFERVVSSEAEAAEAQKAVRDLMQELKVAELTQERLGRMFAYYNENWPEYYGTDRIFVIE